VTFDEQANGQTVVTLRQLHPTRELRDQKVGFGAVELGLQTLEKLAAYLGGMLRLGRLATRASRPLLES
jgi:uncharacterized protein YndB with AHSA1/START domain